MTSTLTSVTFNDTSGWSVCSGADFTETDGVKTCNDGPSVENIDLSNASTNANYFKTTYSGRAFIKN